MQIIALAAALLVAPADTVTPDDIGRAYADVIEVARDGNSERSPIVVRLKALDDVPHDHLLRGFIDENGALLGYLLLNALGFDRDELIDGAGTVEEKSRRFIDALRADSLFRAVTDPLVAAYLSDAGHVVIGVDATPRTISADAMQAVAVRFFYPDTMAPSGHFGGHICVGKNGLVDHPNRDYVVEAIAFSALMTQLRRDPTELQALFRQAVTAAYSLQLSADYETALARAQGVVWHELRDEPLIRSVLTDFVRAREAWLPLRLDATAG